MLYLIGLGLKDEKDITLRGIETAKKCSECFIEKYTSRWFGSLKNLEQMIGKDVNILKRVDIEDRQKLLLDKAKKNDICIFVLGDPLAATTHNDLIIEARKNKIEIDVIHNASIFSAIGIIGLQLYKFGKTATIPFSRQLESVRDTIEMNRKNGLHTLLLLDLDSEINLYMTVKDAINLLINEKIITKKTKLIGLSNVGNDNRMKYGESSEVMEYDFDTPAVIIIPGKLHFQEKEFLELSE